MEIITRIVFALLLTILLQDGGDFSPASERAELSESHHQRHPRELALIESNTDEKVLNVDQKASDQNTNLEWVTSEGVPKDAVLFSEEGKKYYIAKYVSKCELCFYDSKSESCFKILSNRKWESVKISTLKDLMFLVNRDNFELLEWKKYSNKKFPPMSLVVCGKCIAKSADMKTQTDGEVLAINTDIKVQHLNVVEYQISSAVTTENLEVLKHFKASNRNCKSSKHTVKLDQNIDKTYSYQIGKVRTFGINTEVSVSGEIPSIAKILGKLGFKYERSRSRVNTTSVLEKNLHSVSTDVEIPPNHSCTVDITSNILKTEVPFTGEITRVYNNNQMKKTLVNGTYIHQEVDEIETLVNPCQPLSGGTKCN
ncbi:natterin-3-like [Danio rerio]|uniref:Natterin-3-like n=5 Tax=Danio rerio TaxID=7955 RepID=A0A8M9PJV7_DANRE|nr:natterin-3-like [Danio rerio]XP_021329119.1 natterin-3-like [Danio rerio]|eukprot:XP_021325134.1 natterin-3-like [Danio rerio]